MQEYIYGLDIQLYSFKIDEELVHHCDKIRVSITTIPDEKKQHFFINPKKMNNIHRFFTINITKNTQKIVFVFRKKRLINNNPIIASTIIQSVEFPKSIDDPSCKEVKTYSIFEPFCKIRKKIPQSMNTFFPQRNPNGNRRIVGQMTIQFRLTNPFPEQEIHNKNKKKSQKSKGYEKLNNVNENIEQNSYYDTV